MRETKFIDRSAICLETDHNRKRNKTFSEDNLISFIIEQQSKFFAAPSNMINSRPREQRLLEIYKEPTTEKKIHLVNISLNKI